MEKLIFCSEVEPSADPSTQSNGNLEWKYPRFIFPHASGILFMNIRFKVSWEMSWSSAWALWNLNSLHSTLFAERGPGGTSLCICTVRQQATKRTPRENKRTKPKLTKKKYCLAMHPVPLQEDGLCHRCLHVVSRLYWKAEKHLHKAKNINKWWI